MSRPPRPYAGKSTTAAALIGRGAMDYLPSEFADFVERQRALARGELGRVSSEQEGDFELTLMELSAMVAHILGVYQDRFARESFLGTAQSARSLVRHGRRLGYEPNPGMAATGYLLLTVNDGLAGTVPVGFAVASAPVGEQKSQDYETIEDVKVHHQHNELRLSDEERLEGVRIKPGAGGATIEVVGSGFGLQVGDVVVLETDKGVLSAHTVASVTEAPDGATTTLGVSWSGSDDVAVRPGFKLHMKPATRAHLFGWDASNVDFPDNELKNAKAFVPYDIPTAGCGYAVASHKETDLYLDREIKAPAIGKPIAVIDGTDRSAYRVFAAQSMHVAFRKVTVETVDVWTLNANKEPVKTPQNIAVIKQFAANVTALQVGADSTTLIKRTEQQAIRTSLWLLGFERVAPLVHRRPSLQPVNHAATLDRFVEGLEPGQLLALSGLDGPAEDIVEIAEITLVGNNGGKTTVAWTVLDPLTNARPWKRGELRIRGNVARISNGKTVEEVLGDSDGVTPFLRFALDKYPLTHLPGTHGGEPALEVRVGGVLWARVEDFHDSDADDRHYLIQRDEEGITSAVFGDGQKGAIPPAGKRHITARYRVGLGRDGDAGAGQVRRIKKAHPLIARAHNPLRVAGGADPGGANEIRAQAARFVKTFDRAVSAQDHADLSLLFPGVARAAALVTASQQPSRHEVVRVIVADAAGEKPATLLAIKRFLEARRDDTLPLEVTGPEIKHVALRIRLEIDPAFLPEVVRAAVREALHGESAGAPGLFTFAGRQFGQPAFLSEVYAVLTAVPGVAFAEVIHFDLRSKVPSSTPRVVDTIPAAPGEWLRLLPQDLDFSSLAEGRS